MKLFDWLQIQGLNDAEAASLFGTSVGALVKWRRGERVPRTEQLVKIFETTEGNVAPNDFVDLPEIVERTAASS